MIQRFLRFATIRVAETGGVSAVPERRAYSTSYQLPLDTALYEGVTTYVHDEMNRADKLDGKSKGTIGFSLAQPLQDS